MADNSETKESDIKNNNCFVITPIGAQDGRERRFADGITKEVITPVLKEFKLSPVVAHEISETGSINDQVVRHIYNDKLAICNLTGLNPNVMYELGIRFTMRKHTILICENGTSLPFDIIAERTIFYTNDIAGSSELKDQLRNMIAEIDYEKAPDNPIFKVLDYENAMGNFKQEDVNDALIQRLQDLIRYNGNSEIKNINATPFIFTLVMPDGEVFSPDVVLNFNDILMRSSNLKVYASKQSWNSKQNLIIAKFFRETHFEVAKNETIKVANQVFGDKIDVIFLNDDFVD
ncbi:hypothetical protein [Enterococcus casseliflavus]|uniref:hypothetical protein n=1 Tax=Enterococcus casseliflavus TaxID=37734 RepID=UPI003D12E351